MRNIVISLAAVAALSTVALPASAQQQRSVVASPRDRAANGADGAAAPRDRASDRQICMTVELSGSRVTRRVCRTEQEWRARGELETD